MTVLRNLFLLSACVTTPAFAQTAAPDDTARRDDIIVILTLFRGIDAAVRWAPQCQRNYSQYKLPCCPANGGGQGKPYRAWGEWLQRYREQARQGLIIRH